MLRRAGHQLALALALLQAAGPAACVHITLAHRSAPAATTSPRHRRATHAGARHAGPWTTSVAAPEIEIIHVDEVAAAAAPEGVGFDTLGLLPGARHAKLRDNLGRMGMLGPNMVQAHSAPLLLAGRDLVLHASTGSGKTLAFVLPAMTETVDPQAGVQLLILCPSKELAMQTHRSCSALLEGTGLCSLPLVGGVNVARQEERLRKDRPQVIVATPRRLTELALGKAKKLKLGTVKAIVVDEADEVLRPPHHADLLHILSHTRRAATDAQAGAHVQLVFASATGDSPAVKKAACELMRAPALLSVHRKSDAKGLPPTISHGIMRVKPQKRIESLKRVLSMEPRPQALAFVGTAQEADFVSEKLNELGVADVMPVRSSQERDERVTAMQRLLSGKLRAIVCTDIAARGLDVPTLSIVVNMEPPDDARRYVHRAGRCGRAGRRGAVVTIVSSDAQESALQALASRLGITLKQVGIFKGALRWGEADDDGDDGAPALEPGTQAPATSKPNVSSSSRPQRAAQAPAAHSSVAGAPESAAVRSMPRPIKAGQWSGSSAKRKSLPPRARAADTDGRSARDGRSPRPQQPRSSDFTIIK